MRKQRKMVDARCREQLRQERVAFEQASRHDKAWFALRLAMGYLGVAIMLTIFAMTIWVMIHPPIYGPLPLGAAALSMTGQALAISYGIIRLVLQQANVVRLAPLTVAAVPAGPRIVPDRLRTARPGRRAAGHSSQPRTVRFWAHFLTR